MSDFRAVFIFENGKRFAIMGSESSRDLTFNQCAEFLRSYESKLVEVEVSIFSGNMLVMSPELRQELINHLSPTTA